MNHATFQKGKEMQKDLDKAAQTLLYFLFYASHLNPIKKKWAKQNIMSEKNYAPYKKPFWVKMYNHFIKIYLYVLLLYNL